MLEFEEGIRLGLKDLGIDAKVEVKQDPELDDEGTWYLVLTTKQYTTNMFVGDNLDEADDMIFLLEGFLGFLRVEMDAKKNG